MTDNIYVKFRWFRTVETTTEIAMLISENQEWSEIKLVWDSQKLLYESEVSPVPPGRHKTALVIERKQYPCQQFTVVDTTFEVNLFLLTDDIKNSVDNTNQFEDEHLAFRNLRSPADHIDVSWLLSDRLSPNAADLSTKDLNAKSEKVKDVSISPSTVSIIQYNLLVSRKNKEIESLKLEVQQLKLVVAEMESALRVLSMSDESEARQGHELSEELNELQKEKRNMELKAQSLITCIEENEDVRESLEWEVNELRKRLCSNNPNEVTQLITEMRTLREELCHVCRKNKELIIEVLKLREENKAQHIASEQASTQQMKSETSLYYSDLDSGSTQYIQLPLAAASSSKSLPAIATTERVEIPQRSVSLDPVGISPVDSDSLLTDDLLLSFTTPAKVVSGSQTDITAVHGNPAHYRKKYNKTRHRSKGSDITKSELKSKSRRKEKRTTKEVPSEIVFPLSKFDYFRDDRDTSDTEELLQEANQFLLKVTGTTAGILSNEPTNSRGHAASHRRSNQSISPSNKVVNVQSPRQGRELRSPFIPKCALDIQPGYVVRYHGSHGRIMQGKVSFVGPIPDKEGTFIGVEQEGPTSLASSASPTRTFVPFKKVILAWEKWLKT